MKYRKKYDRAALKADFMAGGLTPQAFREKHKLPVAFSYKIMHGWQQEREAMSQRALVKATEKFEKDLEIQWGDYLRANEGLLNQILLALRKYVNPQTGEAKDMPASDVRAFASAIKDLIQNRSFMRGGPTERIETANIHAILVKSLQDRDARYGLPQEPADGGGGT